MADPSSVSKLRLRGSTHFRQRIICSTLSGRDLRIDDIRSSDDNPGIRDHEASFLRLIDKITNGSSISINETGTMVKYRPGVIIGGKRLSHDCGTARGVGYFIEGLILLALFAKIPLEITLTGVTNNDLDLSVDILRTVTLPFLRHFGVEQGLELKVKRRGALPLGGGEVTFKCPIVKELKPIDLVEEGKIRRIRGVAYSTKVSPQFPNRMVESAKGLLSYLTGDVFIYSDHNAGLGSGKSPGFGVSLVAETTKGVSLSAEYIGGGSMLPEDVGVLAGRALCDEIMSRGCVDTSHQSLAFLLMVLCPEDVSRLRVGKLSEYSILFLRQLRDFFGVTFRIEPDRESKTLLFTCRGIGYKNMSRKVL